MNEDLNNTPKRKNDNMMTGLILITVGVIFLFMQFGGFYINNWWALFILIPVIYTWSKAFSLYREAGEITLEAAENVSGSLFLLFVAAIFLFSWDWGRVWPGFIIIVGINALVRTFWE